MLRFITAALAATTLLMACGGTTGGGSGGGGATGGGSGATGGGSGATGGGSGATGGGTGATGGGTGATGGGTGATGGGTGATGGGTGAGGNSFVVGTTSFTPTVVQCAQVATAYYSVTAIASAPTTTSVFVYLPTKPTAATSYSCVPLNTALTPNQASIQMTQPLNGALGRFNCTGGTVSVTVANGKATVVAQNLTLSTDAPVTTTSFSANITCN